MKHLLTLLLAVVLLGSCSPGETPQKKEPEIPLEVSVETSDFRIEVDEVAVLSVSSSEPLFEVGWIGENISRYYTADESLPEDLKLYFGFTDVGTKEIHLEFISVNGKKVTKDLVFEVERGNTVQITQIVVHSFYDMDKTWDPEYPEDDPERLADVLFSLEKLHLSSFTKEAYNVGTWFVSDIRKNQENLVWDLSENPLYINSKNRLRLGLGDKDEDNFAQNLLLDYPSQEIFLNRYEEARPETISLVDENIGLDVTIHVNWP